MSGSIRLPAWHFVFTPLDHIPETHAASRSSVSSSLRLGSTADRHPVRRRIPHVRVGSASRASEVCRGAHRGRAGVWMGGHDLTATMRIYLEAVIGPRTELEDAGLLVEWEVLHVDLAG